jgi:hypothetical protein
MYLILFYLQYMFGVAQTMYACVIKCKNDKILKGLGCVDFKNDFFLKVT